MTPWLKKHKSKRLSKLTCPKWHFGQIGQGGKKTKMEVFLIDFSNKNYYDFLQWLHHLPK